MAQIDRYNFLNNRRKPAMHDASYVGTLLMLVRTLNILTPQSVGSHALTQFMAAKNRKVCTSITVLSHCVSVHSLHFRCCAVCLYNVNYRILSNSHSTNLVPTLCEHLYMLVPPNYSHSTVAFLVPDWIN